MHAISSYRGNRPAKTHTNTATNTQTGPITIHCAAMLSAQCINVRRVQHAHHRPTHIQDILDVRIVSAIAKCTLLFQLLYTSYQENTFKMQQNAMSKFLQDSHRMVSLTVNYIWCILFIYFIYLFAHKSTIIIVIKYVKRGRTARLTMTLRP